jgi:hydroxymethylbilane synthase
VHSAKDLPAVTVPGLALAAVPDRGDPRDALVGCTLADLPEGAEVATGSLRRRAELWRHRPDLRMVELRGNMQTRLARAVEHDAAVVAATALDRLGLADQIAERLAVEVMVPQVAQAALGVECREDDGDLRVRLATIEDQPTRRCVDAERAFLAELGGDCTLPAGAHAVLVDEGLVLTAFLGSPDGRATVRATLAGADDDVGRSLASDLRDRLGS